MDDVKIKISNNITNIGIEQLQRDYEQVLSENGNWLLLYARSLGINDPQEAVQEVFVSIWLRMNAGARIYDPAAYLATALRNLAIKIAKHNNINISPSSFDVRQSTESWFADKVVLQNSDSSDQFYTKQQVQQAVSELKEELREIVVLKIWAGMTFEQISLALGIPMNTAASRYRYALQKLSRVERLRT